MIRNTEFRRNSVLIPYRRNSAEFRINTEFRNLIPAEFREKIPQNSGGLTGQNSEVLNQLYSGQLAYSIRFM